jgi:hypothetical protein
MMRCTVIKLLITFSSISDELYHKSTHFLLELIQNADDNNYTEPKPTLEISYTPGYLRVDCNETGFSPKNIEAICSIGSSTKTGVDNSSRYVGEKGIGFKSVFKVADVVYISSGHYSFKFDRNATLGMIAPIWCDFPTHRRRGCTSFYLQLSGSYNQEELREELKSLDARMLVFLRQLRRIQISIQFGSTTERELTRPSDTQGPMGQIVTLRQGTEVLRYIVMTHNVTGMPTEEKRQGHTESPLLLAFPVNGNNDPVLRPQQLYAFLPVRDYGFNVRFSS